MPSEKQRNNKQTIVKKAGWLKRNKKKTPSSVYSNKITPDELINMESLWGGILFGPIPAGHQRNFFEYKKNVWIWYEGWLGKNGSVEGTMIRYEVRPAGVFKRVNGQKYEKITGAELNNFRMALHQYLKLMKTKLYY